MKKEKNKYLLPVEVIRHKPISWLNITTYEYRLYADDTEQSYSHLIFTDINGLIIGEHMPTKLLTAYDKAALQVKNSTVKAVSEIKSVVDGMADIAMVAASEVKQDVNKVAGIFGRLKNLAKSKLSKEPKSEDSSNLIQ